MIVGIVLCILNNNDKFLKTEEHIHEERNRRSSYGPTGYK